MVFLQRCGVVSFRLLAAGLGVAFLISTASGERPTGPTRTDLLGVEGFNPAVEFQGHYYLVTTAFLDWEAAHAHAIARGGQLVAINSQAEQDFLIQTFTTADRTLGNAFHIGLHDEDEEGVFTWTNGDPVTYTNWAPGEPNGGTGENYTVMNFHYAFGFSDTLGDWNDTDDTYQFRAILEFDSAPEYFNLVVAHSRKCLEVAGVSLAEGANIQQWPCLGPNQPNQLWGIHPVDKTHSRIVSMHSGQCVTVQDGSQNPNANVIQMPCADADHQLFRFQPVQFDGQEWNQIVAKHSGQCLDVIGISQGDGATVLQYPCKAPEDSIENQLWSRQTPRERPDLRPFFQQGWGALIVVESEPGDPNPETVLNFTAPFLDPGATLFADFIVSNVGEVASGGFNVQLLVDGDVVGQQRMELAAGESETIVDLEFGPLSAGTHVLTAIVDSDDEVEESVEQNNSGNSSILIGGPEFLYLGTFGAGLGLASDVVITNLSRLERVRGGIYFNDPLGKPLVSHDLVEGGTEFDLPPGGTRTFSVGGVNAAPAGGELVTGSALVSSDLPVSAVIRFSLAGTGIAGVGSSRESSLAVLPARRVGTLETGIAARNTGAFQQLFSLTLADRDGNFVSSAVRLLEPSGRFSEFLADLFPGVEGDFEGTVTIEGCCFAGVALEFEVGRAFTTLPTEDIRDAAVSLFDLPEPARLTFVPSGAGYTASLTAEALDMQFGEDLGLGEDNSAEVSFPAGFPFGGVTHERFFVNANGNLTFFQPDNTWVGNLDNFLPGPARVAPLFADLSPPVGGSIHADVREDRAVITWLDVPMYFIPEVLSTFQVVLHSDGRIEFTYDEVGWNASYLPAVIGLTTGPRGAKCCPIDFSSLTSEPTGVGSLVYEEFHSAKPD